MPVAETLLLPTEWKESIVVRHLENPYSAEALAEPQKNWIEVDHLELNDFPPAEPVSFPLKPLKQSGEDFILEDQSEIYQQAHQAFMCAAQLIMKASFKNSRVFFDHFSSPLYIGQTHTFSSPHMDGTMPGGVNIEQISSTGYNDLELKLVGIAASGVKTATLQGPAEADDFDGETRTHLKSSAWAEKDFQKQELPLNTLIIMAPSTIHYAQPAPYDIDLRHFLRWQLFA